MTKSKKHGGDREGSGRHLKYGEPTVVIRVPLSMVPIIEKLIAKKYKKPLK